MRICHLTSVHPSDDVRVVRKELLTLAAAGHEVHLVAPDDGRRRIDGIVYHVVPPAADRWDRWSRVRAEVLRRARAVRADVYHCHDIEMLAPMLRLRSGGARVIYDAHEDVRGDVHDKEWIPAPLRAAVAAAIGWWEDRHAARVDAVITATPAIARRFDPGRTTVVQNFPLVDELAALVGRPMRERRRAVLYAGGLSAVRGLDEMLAAAELLQDAGITVALAGAFVSRTAEERARAGRGWGVADYRGLLDRGALKDLLQEVRAGLVVLQPARNHVEAQPNKLFEYMSAGLPVIASHFPLWRTIVEGNGCGLCVDPTRPEEIAAAARWLCDHPEEADAMGARGRQAVVDRYSWASEAETLLQVYARLWSPGAGARAA